ncbi:MAG: DUF6796 family protein [Myxococcota bacterium]
MAVSQASIAIDFQTVQLSAVLGMLGSLTVIVCNTTLYLHGDPAQWSQWSLNLAYWAGSIALPVASLGYLQLLVGLRPAGRWWSVPPVIALMYFFALGSAGHGSCFPVYEFWQGFEQSAEALTIAPVADLKTDLERHMGVLMSVAMAAMFIGSMWFSATVWFKETLYPRWMAFLNVFMISVPVVVVSQIDVLPDIIQIIAAGLGFHLGAIALMMTSLLMLRRRFQLD